MQQLEAGGGAACPLRLVAEPDNALDPAAIQVLDAAGRRLGYVPRWYAPALLEGCPVPSACEMLRINLPPEESSWRLLVACESAWPKGWTFERSQPSLRLIVGDAASVDLRVMVEPG
jgi:hypothetical protein